MRRYPGHVSLLALLMLAAAGLARAEPPAEPEIPTYIGTAQMTADGTIVLHLRAAEGGMVGHSLLTYAPGDPQYRDILQHIGPLKPGGTVAVKPWPATP